MDPVLVTASTDMELSLLISATSALPVPGIGHLKVHRGSCGPKEVIFAVTGIGKVNAACASTLLLERFSPPLLINTGCGGAFPGSGLEVGDLAIASSECLADEGVETPKGWKGLDLIGIPVCQSAGERIFNEIPVTRELVEPALKKAHDHGYRAAQGRFLTVSTCSGTTARGRELSERFPGICENMEGGAVALVAHIYGVPFLEVRGISNPVTDRNLSQWNLPLALRTAQQFMLEYLSQ